MEQNNLCVDCGKGQLILRVSKYLSEELLFKLS